MNNTLKPMNASSYEPTNYDPNSRRWYSSMSYQSAPPDWEPSDWWWYSMAQESAQYQPVSTVGYKNRIHIPHQPGYNTSQPYYHRPEGEPIPFSMAQESAQYKGIFSDHKNRQPHPRRSTYPQQQSHHPYWPEGEPIPFSMAQEPAFRPTQASSYEPSYYIPQQQNYQSSKIQKPLESNETENKTS